LAFVALGKGRISFRRNSSTMSAFLQLDTEVWNGSWRGWSETYQLVVDDHLDKAGLVRQLLELQL
jgi:hypothetical protein